MPFADLVHSPFVRQIRVAHAIKHLAISGTTTTTCSNLQIGPRHSGLRSCYRTYSVATKSSLHSLRERSKTQQTFVFQSTSDNPFHNLAIEHFILQNTDANSRILFFYTNRPCVVIGRNQNPWTECNLKLIQGGVHGKPIDFVRRRSGGGTVFHDEGNLNFSVIVPNDKDFNRRKHSELVVRALNEIRTVSAEYDGPENIWVNNRHDITMATMHNKGRSEFKVSGSAFKLTRGRALHHGTLLHSSPNLDDISKLLKSPGRDWIQAKGVESVRSPVMNIYNVKDGEERAQLRDEIMKRITREFLKFYEANVTTESVGDTDCQHEVNTTIANGVEELKSDEWRFEQTPRFDFTSKSILGKQVTFFVKNGMIEDPRIGLKELSIEKRLRLRLLQEGKIYNIKDWCDVFDTTIVDDLQLATIAQVFPSLQSLLDINAPDGGSAQGVVQHQNDVLVRRFSDGSAEKEGGMNTVEVVK